MSCPVVVVVPCPVVVVVSCPVVVVVSCPVVVVPPIPLVTELRVRSLTLRSPTTRCYPDTRNREPLSWVRRSPDLGGDYQLLVLLAHPLGISAPPRKESCPARRFPPRPQQLLPPGGWLPLPVESPATGIATQPTAQVRLPPRDIPCGPSSTIRTPSESAKTS
jgi:hypothetical protein